MMESAPKPQGGDQYMLRSSTKNTPDRERCVIVKVYQVRKRPMAECRALNFAGRGFRSGRRIMTVVKLEREWVPC